MTIQTNGDDCRESGAGEDVWQVYLIGYIHSRGAGRTFNYRNDGNPPSVHDIESMEKKITQNNGIDGVCITSVSRLADENGTSNHEQRNPPQT